LHPLVCFCFPFHVLPSSFSCSVLDPGPEVTFSKFRHDFLRFLPSPADLEISFIAKCLTEIAKRFESPRSDGPRLVILAIDELSQLRDAERETDLLSKLCSLMDGEVKDGDGSRLQVQLFVTSLSAFRVKPVSTMSRRAILVCLFYVLFVLFCVQSLPCAEFSVDSSPILALP